MIRKWLINQAKVQDLIASSSVIAGFEWSSVLMMTSNNHKSHFSLRNMVMRAMCRLVWLKTNSLDEVQEQGNPAPSSTDIHLCRARYDYNNPNNDGSQISMDEDEEMLLLEADDGGWTRV